jgi:Cation transporting ATPase, C-terminus
VIAALKASDVGLAMGIAGTEVAKEACDIIITDDNFASIVNSILWGRSVYDNVRSFLQFQLTVNIVALLLTFIAAVMQEDPPLNPVMMLWVNLIMDTMGALALATQTPSKELLERKPFAASAFLVSPKMWRHLLVQSLFQLITLLVLLKVAPASFGITIDSLTVSGFWITSGANPTSDDVTYYTNSFIFNTFVFSQIWNEFNARSLDDRWNIFRGIFSDLTFIAIIIVSAGVQALLVQFGGNFVHTTGLSAKDWGYTILISLITFPLGIVMRLIPVNDKASDYAEFYMTFFAKQMEVQLEQNRDTHPAFAKGANGGKSAPTLDASAHVHGLPVPAGAAGIEMTNTPAKEPSKRNILGAAPPGVSIRSNISDGPIAAPLSPTNELGMIQGLSTSGLAASPTGDHGFSANKFATGGSGNSSTAPTGASTATPSLVELQGVVVTGGAGALPAAGSSSVPQPPSPAMGASDESRPLVN